MSRYQEHQTCPALSTGASFLPGPIISCKPGLKKAPKAHYSISVHPWQKHPSVPSRQDLQVRLNPIDVHVTAIIHPWTAPRIIRPAAETAEAAASCAQYWSTKKGTATLLPLALAPVYQLL